MVLNVIRRQKDIEWKRISTYGITGYKNVLEEKIDLGISFDGRYQKPS